MPILLKGTVQNPSIICYMPETQDDNAQIKAGPCRSVLRAGKFANQLGLKYKAKLVEQIKYTIQGLVKEHFTPTLPLSAHDPIHLAEFEGKLRKKFPDVFDHTDLSPSERQKRMSTAVTYMKDFLRPPRNASPATRETRLKSRSTKMASKFKPDVEIIDLCQDDSDDNDNPLPTTARRQNAMPQLRPRSDRIKAISSTSTPGYTTVKTEEVPAAIPPTPVSGPYHRTTQFPTRRTNEVAHFLKSCAPDMYFLLDSFIAFGCCNREYLEYVAGCGDIDIEEFIKAVTLRHPPARLVGGLSEMDAWLLKHHFKRYFAILS